jgi:hypothetical protein
MIFGKKSRVSHQTINKSCILHAVNEVITPRAPSTAHIIFDSDFGEVNVVVKLRIF